MTRLSKNSIFVVIITCSIAFITGSLPVVADIQMGASDTPQNDFQADEQYYIASLDNLIVTVSGLKEGDQAIISLLPSISSDKDIPFIEKTITGGKEVEIDMSSPLKDGYYKLQIVADESYFREPKAWLFSVIDSEIVNPARKSAVFELIPPENQKYRPKRESKDPISQMEAGSAPPPSNEPEVMAECMLSLSAAPKEPLGSKSTGYHHFGYHSTLSCPGIQGRFEVVDPGVRHGATGEIAVDHIYASNSTGNEWMEIGWAEVNFDDDVQYLFEYDSYRNNWRLYDLPANPVEVSLFNYDSAYWSAMYLDGGYWTLMASENVGFSNASHQYNAGEVYTDYGTHPSFPAADTDVSKLYISGEWKNWDWQRWATTSTLTCDTYDIHTSTVYYDFYIHKH